MGSKAVKDAINDLGRFFGIRSADAYLNAILGDVKNPFPISGETTTSNARAKLLNAICGAGDTSAPTAEAFLSYCKNQGGTEKEKGKISLEDFAADICVTPNSDDGVDEAKMPVNKLEVKISGGKTCKDQGLGKPKNTKYWTMNDLRASPATSDDAKLSVIQVFPSAGNVTNSDTDVTALFLNAIPTLEMSRAIPFIDIMVIARATDDPNKTREMSLGRWMLGEDIENDPFLGLDDNGKIKPTDPMFKNMLSAEDKAMLSMDAEADKEKQFRTAATMEAFTSPQTMVSLSTDPDGGDPFRPFLTLENLKLNVAGAGGMFSYKSGDMELKLHDKTKLGAIAPLIAPGANGRIRFVITYGWSHPDAASFQSAWSSGMPRKSDLDANRFGELIDSMKVTETYQVVNSESTFEENGEVSINVKLSLMGASGMDRVDITLSEVVDFVEELQSVFEDIQKALEKYTKKPGATGKIAVPQVLKQGSNMSSARNLETKQVKELFGWINKRKRKDPIVADIDKFCRKVFGKKGTENGLVKSLNATKNASVVKIIKRIKTTPDPFLRPVGLYDGRTSRKKYADVRDKDIKSQNTVSLGKLLSIFIGESLESTGQYDEVQLVFHAFNESASYLYDYNIAQFPISISDLETILKKKFEALGSMSISGFLSMINTFFINDPAAQGYGFDTGNIYGDRDKENLSQRKLNNKAKNKKFVMEDHKRGVLKTAYGITDNFGTGVTFKQPQLHAKIQSYPSRAAVEETSENPPQPDKTVLKIQIFDTQCNTVETLYSLFQGFSGAGIMSKLERPGVPKGSPSPARGPRHDEVLQKQLDILLTDQELIESAEALLDEEKADNDKGITYDDLKSFVKNKYRIKPSSIRQIKNTITALCPSLIWGGGTAGLSSAKLSTQNDPALMSVNMIRAGKSDETSGKDGIPMQILPTELQVDMMGCPYVSFGQQYFVDFGTNSTADNFYGVCGVDHTITAGEFKTSVKMINMQAYGRYRSPFDNLADLAIAAHLAKKKKK